MPMKKILKLLVILYFAALAFGCAGTAGSQKPAAHDEGDDLYLSIKNELAKDGQHIDYDTLISVYKKMTEAPCPIPHTDELLYELIRQRNEDLRVDKMAIILAAMIMGESKYPIPDAEKLFETMLNDESRVTDWVIANVGRAVGSYLVDLANGDQLVSTMKAHQARLEAQTNEPEEYFGTHFMPPPKTQLIKSYIAGIQDRKLRESERRAYYILIMNDITESSIASAFNYLMSQDASKTTDASQRPMRYMVLNWKYLQEALNLPQK